MEYYNPDNRSPILWASLATFLYLVVGALLMIFVHFTIATPEKLEEGILVDFGVDDAGLGEEELVATDVETAPVPKPQEVVEEELLSDPNSEAEVAVEEIERKPKEEKVEEKRVVNKNALFPGRTEQSTTKDQGSNTEKPKGNQGVESGDKGDAVGGGEGNSASFQLKDRSVVGSLPVPSYGANATGKVVISITVDKDGNVKSTDYVGVGSTTNDSQLIAAARAAAKKAKFTPSDNLFQGGTITYIFKMN